MSISTDSIAKKIQERLKEVHELMHEVENAREQSESTLKQIENYKSEIEGKQKSNTIEQRKIKLSIAINDAKKEEELLRNSLEKIDEIRSIRSERRQQARSAGNKEPIRRGALMKMLLEVAHTMPLYIGQTIDASPPPLCGCIPAESCYIAKPGNIVAAFVKGADEEENWILAEIISFNHLTNKYEIDDIDEEVNERHIISRRRVMPLPIMRANPETDPQAIFTNGTIVMALYPQTTCFYKAIITAQPKTAHEDYEVIFEDATYTNGYSPPLKVPQRYVISIKESKKRIKVN
ncbi:PREDICTED: SAGA-associated factor 29 homolog, partial [Ceratosolen solmsi marchali]|uniref:SAGA-associated factor 29 homolog n=1 Tax=Ceratosolen solmsi marchali TaxID=326594 RepID=A0AAJ6YW45_9HYME